MSNYPDDIRQYDDNPNSPFFDDSGLEDAHTAKCEEIEADMELIAEIISELSGEKYTEMQKAINKSISGIGFLMMDTLSDVDCEAYQIVLANNWQDLPVEAHLIIEEAISEYAMSEVLN